MYSPEFERLIALCLVDGVISDKEKKVLFKKARELNIDEAELEVVLEARLLEKPIDTSETKGENASISLKYGDAKKCPGCGSLVEGFTAVCGYCNYDYKNIKANSTLSQLQETFLELDKVYEREVSKRLRGIPAKPKFMLFPSDYEEKVHNINVRNDNVADSLANKRDQKKIQAIEGVPVPTTKEDMLEFLTFSVPLGRNRRNGKPFLKRWYIVHKEFETAWNKKSHQIILKAKIALKDDKKGLEEVLKLEKELNGLI